MMMDNETEIKLVKLIEGMLKRIDRLEDEVFMLRKVDRLITLAREVNDESILRD